ncbi:zinc-ribbon domain-containing protein [Frondihabitans australicus]|uniref:Putative zinc ribbon protein n=1 Tax=Frondihabitans australicus TaxID=386892 RepID=A0A495IKE9_9MICO|nr:hypothetical protein [Frondihabitans australicus]RKR75771.1 putative zinc ribbon protein [Frondihabitans australicus]
MPEPIDAWWARRQTSRGQAVPYAVGAYREAWASYPALVRQYHPEFNSGIVLSQIPPAADVYLCWQCEVGHLFVATPDEQRSRPGRQRRRSAWCPQCSEGAGTRPKAPAIPMRPGRLAETGTDWLSTASSLERRPLRPDRPAATRRPAVERVCPKTPRLADGVAFVSSCAPLPASAVEQELRAALAERLSFTADVNAVKLPRPFFDHLEAWPDVVIPELQVAVEYDSTGRHGLEHVGAREAADRRKDRSLRGVRWEVVRIRTGRLPALGPFDLTVAGLSRSTVPRLLDTFRAIRGPLFVDAYLR